MTSETQTLKIERLGIEGAEEFFIPFGEEIPLRDKRRGGVFGLVSGAVRVVTTRADGGESTITILQPGEWFSARHVPEDIASELSWRAMEDCAIRFVPANHVAEFDRRNASVAREIQALAERIERLWTVRRVEGLADLPEPEAIDLYSRAKVVSLKPGQAWDLTGSGDALGVVASGSGNVRAEDFPDVHAAVSVGSVVRHSTRSQFSSPFEPTRLVADSSVKLVVLPLDRVQPLLNSRTDAVSRLENQVRRPAEEWTRKADRRREETRFQGLLNTSFGRSIPVVRQLDSNDCAAACLVSVLRFHGASADIAKVREQLHVNKAGTRLHDLTVAAERRGFTARTVKTSLQWLEQSPLPAICHWESGHYVAVYRFTKKHVVLMDPAVGLRRLSRDEFLQGWTEYALYLEPTRELTDDAPSKGVFSLFFDAVRREGRVLLDIVVASSVLQLLVLVSPLLMQLIVDRVLVFRSASMLNLIVGGMLAAALFEIVISNIRQFLLSYATERIDARLAGGLYRHLVRLPISFFELRSSGDIIKRFSDNRVIRDLLSTKLISTGFDVLTATAYLCLMVMYNPFMAGCALAGLVPYFVVLQVSTIFLKKKYRELFKTEAAQEAFLIESLSGVESLKNLGLERQAHRRYEELALDSVLKRVQTTQIAATTNAVGQVFLRCNTVLLLWLGASAVIDGEMTVGQMIAFQALAMGLLAPAGNVLNFLKEFQESQVAAERISEIYAVEEEARNESSTDSAETLHGDIRLENVSYRYPSRPDINVLSNVSLSIRPGQIVGIVGKSGSGKSTLAKLLIRNYQPSEGRITIDGRDVSRMSLTDLRRNVGIVSQDVFLFDRTIRENIAVTNPDAPFVEITAAARAADCHDFIMNLPQGYDTRLGERAQTLSGGQRQRLSIARMLFRKTPVVVLDEATSALDSQTEMKVQRQVLDHLKGATVIVIAHRLSTLRKADRVFVLDQGLLVEEGSHEELLARKGLYETMWRASSSM